MTDHPAKGCTKRQIEVFEQICVGNDGGHHPKTLEALDKKGLIELRNVTLPPTRTCPWPVTIKVPHVPQHILIQWCEWCDENVAEVPF